MRRGARIPKHELTRPVEAENASTNTLISVDQRKRAVKVVIDITKGTVAQGRLFPCTLDIPKHHRCACKRKIQHGFKLHITTRRCALDHCSAEDQVVRQAGGDRQNNKVIARYRLSDLLKKNKNKNKTGREDRYRLSDLREKKKEERTEGTF